MALIICSECGKEISDKAHACIHCGCPVEQSSHNTEPTSYQVILTDYPPQAKIAVIKQLRLVVDCGLAEAKTISESTPCCFAKDISSTEAKRIQQLFASIGANVQIQRSGTNYSSVVSMPKQTSSGVAAHEVQATENTKSEQKTGNSGIGCLVFVIIFALIGLLSILGDTGRDKDRTCAWCNGTGYNGNGAKDAIEYVLKKTPCTHCDGTGTY